MNKLTCYRQYIQDFLTEQAQGKVIGGDIETEVVFDWKHDRFLLIDLGWHGFLNDFSINIFPGWFRFW